MYLCIWYANSQRNAIVRQTHPQIRDSQGQATFSAPSFLVVSKLVFPACVFSHKKTIYDLHGVV